MLAKFNINVNKLFEEAVQIYHSHYVTRKDIQKVLDHPEWARGHSSTNHSRTGSLLSSKIEAIGRRLTNKKNAKEFEELQHANANANAAIHRWVGTQHITT